MAKKAQKNQGTKAAEEFKLADKLSLNGDTGIFDVSDDFLEATLADTDLTVEVFKKAQEFQVKTRAAVIEAAAPMVHNNAKENKDVESYSLSYNFGHHTETVNFTPFSEQEEAKVRIVTDYNEPNKGEITKAMKDCASLFDYE